jgi:pSer/pThr/pTyr-binding forkhead associated (FHA) protein
MNLDLKQLLEGTSCEDSCDYVMVMNGPEDGRWFPLNKSLIMVGRSDSSDICLRLDPVASRTHARITNEEGTYYIEDLHSRYGTEIDGTRIDEKSKINDHSSILIGETCLRICSNTGKGT